ncbi:MAG: hypothetical protein KDB07_13255, partial [Planctomycetes bacterium]|nr:hypothetical protein [Planctomycetota bacterium]
MRLQDVVTFTASFDGSTLQVRAEHDAGWHTYAFNNTELGGGSGDLKIMVEGGLEVTGAWAALPAAHLYEATGDWVYEGTTVFTAAAKQVSNEPAKITFGDQICNDQSCLPFFQDEESTLVLELPLPTDFSASVAYPDDEPKVTYKVEIRGDELAIRVSHAKGWHTYAFDNASRGGMSNDTKITLEGGLALVGPLKASAEAHDVMDAETKKLLGRSVGDFGWGGEVVFTGKLERRAAGEATLKIEGQTCDEMGCLFFAESDALVVGLPATLVAASNSAEVDLQAIREKLKSDVNDVISKALSEFSEAEAKRRAAEEAEKKSQVEQEQREKEEAEKALAEAAKQRAEGKKSELLAPPPSLGKRDASSSTDNKEDESIWAFILKCVSGGLLALIMPCVFPMIPITVSFFSKQADAT